VEIFEKKSFWGIFRKETKKVFWSQSRSRMPSATAISPLGDFQKRDQKKFLVSKQEPNAFGHCYFPQCEIEKKK